MFDHVPPTVFWPVFALLCGIVTAVVLALLTRYTDRNNPYRNIRGRQKMASDYRKPSWLPKDWK